MCPLSRQDWLLLQLSILRLARKAKISSSKPELPETSTVNLNKGARTGHVVG